MISHPLVALAVRTGAGEDVKTSFEPIVPALRDFHRLVLLVIGRVAAIRGGCGTLGGEVTVQFHHRVARSHRIRAVDLHLIVALGKSRAGKHEECE